MILTSFGDSRSRAKIGATYLMAFKRQDVPIAIGEGTNAGVGPLFAWAADTSLAAFSAAGGRILENGTGQVARLILANPGRLSIVALSPHTSLAVLVNQYPAVVSMVPHVFMMAGSITRCYGNSAAGVLGSANSSV